MADIFAVSYYHRHASWKYIVRIIPEKAYRVFLLVTTAIAAMALIFG